MAEITPNPQLNEINLFKNEIYGLIRELETKLNSKIIFTENKLLSDLEKYEAKINSLMGNTKEMVISLVSQNLKLEKITELEKFKQKADSQMITHELRIKNNLEEISAMKLKYDKIISENLYVSGFIGSTCQFKNVSEYLLYNINEVSRIKTEKDQLKKDTKELKGKTETLTKNMVTLNDKSVQLCNKYTDNKQAEFQKALDITSKDLNEKNMEMRTLMLKFKEDQEENEKRNIEQFNKLVNMKEEFINLINNKFLDIKKLIDDIDNKISNNSGNIVINKNKIETINGQIKELYKSDKDILFQIRNYYFANNKLANLMDKFGTGSSKADINNLMNEMNSNVNNNTINQPRRRGSLFRNSPLMRPKLEDVQPIKKYLNNSIEKKNKINKKKEENNRNDTSESESSSYVENKKNNKNKENIISYKNIEEEKKINEIKVENNIEAINNEVDRKVNSTRPEESKLKDNNILPLLNTINKDENTIEENKKISNSINQRINSALVTRKKKKNLILLLNNESRKKINQKKDIMKKDVQLLEKDRQSCKVVTLNLVDDPIKETLQRKKMIKDKVKLDMINTLVSSYRAKLTPKMHTPEEKIEIKNEILEMPKKITQAFGRTTYTFYFKKEALSNFHMNKNNNINRHVHSVNFKRNNKEDKIANINKFDTGH